MVDAASASISTSPDDPVSAQWNLAQNDADSAALAEQFGQLGGILENFLELTGLAVAITDLNGTILAASRWQSACMDYHRSHPTSLERCRESNACLTRMVANGESAMTTCGNGLTDCAAPIVINGRHIATLYAGQFLTSPPDRAFFQRQQQECGYDAAGYERAITGVPVVEPDRIPAILRLLTGLAEHIARQTLAEQKVRHALQSADALVRERSRELAENHDRLHKIAARAPGVMYQFVRSADGRFTMPFASDAVSRMLGVDAETLRGDASVVFSLVLPEDQEEMRASCLRSADDMAPWDHEFRVGTDPADCRWLHGNSVPEAEADGSIVWYGFLSDVTERKRREALLQAQVRVAESADELPLHSVLVATLDEACALTGSTTGFYHFFEADQNALSLQAWSTRTTREYCTASAESTHYPLREAGIWADAARLRRPVIVNDYSRAEGRKGLPDGHSPLQRMISVPILRDGAVKALIGVGNKPADYDDGDVRTVAILADLAWNVAERKRAEDALEERTRQVERRYESLRALNEIAALPPSGGADPLALALELGARHLGLPRGLVGRVDGDELELLNTTSGAPAGQRLKLAETYCALTLEAEDVTAITDITRSRHAGHPCHAATGLVSYIGAPVLVDGKPFGSLGFGSPQPYARDFDDGDCEFIRLMARWIGTVIERRQAAGAIEKALTDLARSNEELAEFAYAASHDLRQPLRMVSSYLGLIERRLGPGLDEENREFLQYAMNGAIQMDRLIVDLLEYSRVGRQGDTPEPVQLAEVMAEAGRNLTVAFEECGGRLELADIPATIRGNRTELIRLFQNLIGNAVKYRAADRNPVVKVGWERKGAQWRITVADNGIGIADQYLKDIFKIFRRLHTSRDYEGSGIGLAICQKIVKNHGGKIWVESEPGIGSTFIVTLPQG